MVEHHIHQVNNLSMYETVLHTVAMFFFFFLIQNCFRGSFIIKETLLKYCLLDCREFTKTMVVDPPFCYWTINERYRDEDLPSFDICPAIDEDQDLRLRLRPNTREDSSMFVAG